MKTYCLEVTGDFACFTRPEMKVERVSYDVITPSAARACFEAILWKPAIRWHIRRIEVLKPIRWMNLRRNEVNCIASPSKLQPERSTGNQDQGFFVEDKRLQRAGLLLRDVAYRLHADLEFLPAADPGAKATKYQQMFERRAMRGQCINQPYLGCREFAADFRLIENVATEQPPIPDSQDLGFMLYDLDFSNSADPTPRFFRAKMKSGAVHVPPSDSEEVHG